MALQAGQLAPVLHVQSFSSVSIREFDIVQMEPECAREHLAVGEMARAAWA